MMQGCCIYDASSLFSMAVFFWFLPFPVDKLRGDDEMPLPRISDVVVVVVVVDSCVLNSLFLPFDPVTRLTGQRCILEYFVTLS